MDLALDKNIITAENWKNKGIFFLFLIKKFLQLMLAKVKIA
jgi:hypothetical protein